MGLFDKKTKNSAEISRISALMKELYPDIEFAGVEGDWGVREGSSLVRIVVETDVIDDVPTVNIIGHVLWNVKESLDLYRTMLSDMMPYFARWEVFPHEKGGVNLVISRRQRIDTLDAPELHIAIDDIAGAADSFDDLFQEKFGGKRTEEELDWSD